MPHRELGDLLRSNGELDAAIPCYEEATALEPSDAASHSGLGLARLAVGLYPEAVESLRCALLLHRPFPEARMGLASALEALGRHQEALEVLKEAIESDLAPASALIAGIELLIKMGRMEDAAKESQRLLDLEPENSLAHHTIGVCLCAQGQSANAERRFRQALAFKPGYPEAKESLALLLRSGGRTVEAITLLAELVDEHPNPRYRSELAETLNGFALQRAGETSRRALAALCKDDDISPMYMHPSIISLMKADDGFRSLLTQARGNHDDARRRADPSVDRFLRDDLFLSALPRMPITDTDIELVCTCLRRRALNQLCPEANGATDVDLPHDFICALARQCFFAGYVFDSSDDESVRVDNLGRRLERTLSEGRGPPEPLLAIYSAYRPLTTLENFRALLERERGLTESLRTVVAEQIADRMKESEIGSTIEKVTDIDDATSIAVRAQYEENPYPRWVALQSPNPDTFESLMSRLLPAQRVQAPRRPVQILIAGCGTGHVPIQFAKSFGDAEILAVDLSLSSLAYASRMAKKLNVTNVAFRQGDILKLGALGRRFSIVESSGVLHHLEDPMAGWRVLVDLMEPFGLMKIGLYSSNARQSINAARQFAGSQGLPPTPDGMRTCRRAILGLPKEHPATGVLKYPDFFVLDGFRDMIMHVKEHQFTLPRIARYLDDLELQFLGIEAPASVAHQFSEMFPGVDMSKDLEAWNRFEETHPDTFIGMYQFWCRKKSAVNSRISHP